MQVRRAGPADAGAVEHVLRSSYPTLMAGAYDAALLARALPLITKANPKLLASGSYYLAESNGFAVGCGGWTAEEPGNGAIVPGLAHIRHFGVSHRHIGHGIGRALFERCEVEARAAGMTRFECHASLNGEAFYAALGFRSAGAIAVPMGPDLAFPSIRMHRPI